jgi:Raf kinase inhibitor-like YbhB/YbcL family protein
VTSAAFADRASIPRRYTCEGENLSPPLAWQGVPARARSLALICDDPDAPMGTWVHWVLFNLRASARGLPAAVPPAVALAGGARQGVNGFQKPGYGGPCPPPGKAHRYFFKLYALDAPLALSGAVTKRQLEAAMKGHVLGRGQLVGTYRR